MKKIIFVSISVTLNTHWSQPTHILDPIGPFFAKKAAEKWIKKFRSFCRSHNEIDHISFEILVLNARARRAPKTFLDQFINNYVD